VKTKIPDKVRTNITVDPEVLKKARELGLNVSKIAEDALENT
jgi:post-segregation antitoxin (ccd killing protein)